MWSPAALTEVNTTAIISRSHFKTLFDMSRGLFLVETLPTANTRTKVRKTINVEEVNCSCCKWQLYHRLCSHFITCCTLRNVDYVQFVDHFFSNELYKAAYTPYF